MENHLIIGLGGTGGKVLREMRKRIFEEFRSNDSSSVVHIEYLYVDSSPTDLNDRSSWKTLGGSVHLSESQKVSIHGIGASVLSNLSQYPGIQSFINDDDRALFNDLGTLITDGIGGQRRRLGRLLFANNLSGPSNKSFITQLQSQVQKLTGSSGEQRVTFHVCAGLAGGTGSGSIVDTVAQIRKLYGPSTGIGDQYKLHLYLYVPELIIADPTHNAGYYQSNGYAALTELNAMSVGAYRPFDVSGQSRDEFGNIKRLLDCDAFESAYLYTNANEVGRQLNIKTDLPAAVADFLFQKIVVAAKGVNGQMARLNNCENNGTAAEKDEAGRLTHSRKFISFGVNRIEYPETEIREYVTYSFAKQAAKQLQYNLWRDGIGFEECSIAEVGVGFGAEIQEKKTLERLLISDNHLTLSKPIISNKATDRWKQIASGWENNTQIYADDAQNGSDKKSWLATFTADCELYYNSNYRGLGVKDFYKTQRGERNGYAAYIRRHIEEWLFEEWHKGAKSMLEIEKYVSLLIVDCEKRSTTFKGKLESTERLIGDELEPEVRRCNEEWNNIGWLRDAITGASARVFAAYKSAKCELYTALTRIEGYAYASELLLFIKAELEQMLKNISLFRVLLTETLKIVDDKAESKCKVNVDEDGCIVKKYDPEEIRSITRRFTTDESHQKQNASLIRQAIVNGLGEGAKRSFGTLLEKFDLSTTEDVITDICMDSASQMMNDLASADSTLKMLDVNILEKIKQEFNSDERLEVFIKSIVASARCYLQFNAEEMSKVIPGCVNDMKSMVQLSLPEYNDPTNFRQKFIDMFAGECPGFNAASDLSVNYKDNQIVVVAAASGFPLRFVANVATLKERYNDATMGVGSELSKMVLHTETLREGLPELFEKSVAQKEREIIPTTLLAYAMDLAIDKTNPTTGETFKAIGFPDELGLIGNWINLGKNPMQAVKVLSNDFAGAVKISALVEEKLKGEYLHNEKKTALKGAIAALLNDVILPLCSNNDQDPKYMMYRAAAIEIINTKLVLK